MSLKYFILNIFFTYIFCRLCLLTYNKQYTYYERYMENTKYLCLYMKNISLVFNNYKKNKFKIISYANTKLNNWKMNIK